MKSNMVHSFSLVPQANIPRSKFKQVENHKTAFDFDKLIPQCVFEVLPGDTYKVRGTGFGRLATPLHPIMDNMYLDTFWFFVPYRIIWDNWKKFCGEQETPGDSIDYTIPEANAPATTGFNENSLMDYMGLPTKIPDYGFSDLPIRAYWKIFNEWFRDQNLVDDVTILTGDTTPVYGASHAVGTRAKRHDYFTSCLPWPQKAPDGAVDLPLGTTAPVLGIAAITPTTAASSGGNYETGASSSVSMTGWRIEGYGSAEDAGESHLFVEEDANNTGYPGIYADLSNATAATINQLRQAFQIQKLQERDARGGTRYIEILRSHFGIVNAGGDARLQRPEYLGGSVDSMDIHTVPQTSETGTTAQGTLTAFGTVQVNTGFTRSFTEHGVVMMIVNGRADLTYSQGLDRMWSRSTRYDFYWPALAQIGEQEVYTKEMYCQDPTTDTGSTGTPDNDKIFGYIGRYDEYRYGMSKISSVFRPNATTSLESWHLSQEFTSLPTLNSTFIESNTPVDRAIAVASEPHLIFDFFLEKTAIRPMPLYGVPGNIDHF
jgi:hypothetical protein